MKISPLYNAINEGLPVTGYNKTDLHSGNMALSNPAMFASIPLRSYAPMLGNFTGLSFAPSFGAKLQMFNANKPEIRQGLEDLGKEEIALIIHGGSFPSTSETDTGFGSPNSTGARNLIDFISGVFTAIQLGPNGKTKEIDSSPYTGTLFSSNPLFIDLEQLTEEKWGNILPKEDFKNIVINNKRRGRALTNYRYIYKEQDKALRTAYGNFISSDNHNIKKLQKEFAEYKNAEVNDPWLDNDAIYEALSKKHNTDYWPNWNDELDKNLMAKKDTPEGRKRLAQIRKDYAEDIDFYKFTQFLYSKQISETKKYANSKGIKFIADKQVAFSDRDTWAYQDLFLKGWNLGCPPDYFAKDGQAWGFPVLDPKKLFNPDGSLGEAGKILKKSITKVFKEYNALRIDHYLGLVDPWVYPEGKTPKASNGAGRLYSSCDNPNLKQYSYIEKANIDSAKVSENMEKGLEWAENDYVDGDTLSKEQINKYALYIDKILLSAARDALVKGDESPAELKKIEKEVRNSLIIEDLGAMTTPAAIVMHERKLNGIKVAQFMDGGSKDSNYLPTTFNREGEEYYWYMAGSHDNKPLSRWAKDMVKAANSEPKQARTRAKKQNAINQIEYIADYLYSNNKNYDKMKEKMFSDPKFLMQSVYAMMLKSPAKNIQIFFSDLFGDTRTYNTPGTPSEFNWKTRPRNNFEKQYEKALDDGMAFDFKKGIKTAIRSREEDKRAEA